MINIIFLAIAVTGLVLLYLQWRNNAKQEAWIKKESVALSQLQEQNRHFLITQLYLRPENLLLYNPAPQPLLQEQRRQLLVGKSSFRKRKMRAYHLF